MTKQQGFEAKVLTHLEYIRKDLDEHKKIMKDNLDVFNNQVRLCDGRFNNIEKEQSNIKGIYMGAAAVLGAIAGWFSRFFK